MKDWMNAATKATFRERTVSILSQSGDDDIGDGSKRQKMEMLNRKPLVG